MKKLLLLLAGSLSMAGANAQYAKNNSMVLSPNTKGAPIIASRDGRQTPAHKLAARTTAVTIATENFGSGTASTLPTGWTTGIISGPGKWHWSNVASTSAYSLGTIASTTASNGWMIFDSDSIGTACGCAPAGWLQSPAYNCTGHLTVRLNFEELYRSFNDSCVVWVSTSSAFTTYTRYALPLNSGLAANAETANPATIHLNISSVAAGAATVYIRFVYYGASGGSYSWLVDDMSLTELNAHDVAVASSFMWEPEATAYSGSIFNTPKVFVDSVYPVTQLSNNGANAETNVVTTAKIYEGTTSVYSQSNTYPSLPLNAFDTLIQFPGYLPATVGNYTCVFNAPLANDSDLSNNNDTATFAVTDTTWMENQGLITGSYYLHRATTPISFMDGVRFDVPTSSVGDTVSGFGVVFSSSSVPTTGSATVSVQLYSITQGATGWTYVATSQARAITASDISTTSATIWADFRIDPIVSGGVAPFVLQPGTSYAAMIQIKNVSTDLLVDVTAAPNGTGIFGYFGQSDTSNDDGASSFSPTSIATGDPSIVPLVRMYFGNIPSNHTGVNNISLINTVGTPYPNPANTAVTVPFTLSQDAVATVTLTNMVGQVVKSQNVQATAGQTTRATFSTTDLADGMYIYNVSADGQHSNGRIVVAH